MKEILIVLAVVAVIFFGYPLINENTTDECDALERRLVVVGSRDRGERALYGALQNAFSKGFAATSYAKDKFPSLPPPVACAAGYWDLLRH